MVGVALLYASMAFATDAETPSGEVALNTGSGGLLIGVSGGQGTLKYAGEDIPITMGGISFLDVGGVRGTASGTVHNLARIEDFDGTYLAAGVGLTVVAGGTAVTMQNQNGVVVRFVQTNQGLNAKLDVGGVRMEIDRPLWAAQRAEQAAARATDAARRVEAAVGRVETAALRTESAVDQLAQARGRRGLRESPTAGVRAPQAPQAPQEGQE